MKILRLISFFLVVVFALSSIQMIAFAETESDCSHSDDVVTVEFLNEISDSSKEKIIAHFNGKEKMDITAKSLSIEQLAKTVNTIILVEFLSNKISLLLRQINSAFLLFTDALSTDTETGAE